MSDSYVEYFLNELVNQFGERRFYTTRDLIKIGFFGSLTAARQAVRKGDLPFVKVSARRYVISRQSLLDYLEQNQMKKIGR